MGGFHLLICTSSYFLILRHCYELALNLPTPDVCCSVYSRLPHAHEVNNKMFTGYPIVVIGSLVFNVLVLSLTIIRTLQATYTNRELGIKKSIHWYLLRDGKSYTCVIISVILLNADYEYFRELILFVCLQSQNMYYELRFLNYVR